MHRHRPLAESCPSVLPLPILAGFSLWDQSGWYCGDCGKVNQQLHMRHRKCSSSFCKVFLSSFCVLSAVSLISLLEQDTPLSKGYFVGLDHIREYLQVLPISLPVNRFPASIEPSITTWPNKMCTLSYTIDASRSVLVKHLFTCNLQTLQTEATTFWKDFQENVDLSRKAGSSGMSFRTWEPKRDLDIGISRPLFHLCCWCPTRIGCMA